MINKQLINNNRIELNKLSKEEIRGSKIKISSSLLAKKVLIKGENKRKFEELRTKILGEVLPITEIEKILCDKFISAVLKHDRAIEIERNMLNKQNQPIQDEEDPFLLDPFSKSKKRIRNINKVFLNTPDIQKILKYQVSLEKNMLKILERIREEQRIRVTSNLENVGTITSK